MTATVLAWDTGRVPRRPPTLKAGPDEWAAWRVRYERERRDWSQGELARRVTEAGAPMQQQHIWRIENGTPPRRISYGEAVAFCKVFGIDDVADLGKPPASVAMDMMGKLHAANTEMEKASERLLSILGDLAAQEDYLAGPLRDAEQFYLDDFYVYTGQLDGELAQQAEARAGIRQMIGRLLAAIERSVETSGSELDRLEMSSAEVRASAQELFGLLEELADQWARFKDSEAAGKSADAAKRMNENVKATADLLSMADRLCEIAFEMESNRP